MPEEKQRIEPLDDATLKTVVGGATDKDIDQNCPPPPPPPPPPAPAPVPAPDDTSSGGTGNGGSGGPRR